MHVLFVEPCFPSYQSKFVDALCGAGAAVTGIGETPYEYLPQNVKERLTHYEHVRSVVDEGALYQAVRRCQQRGWVDRLEATIEAHILPVAKVREATGIPGTTPRTAFLCRDKPAMKEVLRKAGIPCAMSCGADSPKQVREFAKQVGLPIIIKPTAAAGAAGTYRANNAEELEQAIKQSGVADGATVAVEEFIEGHEGFYDTICVNGHIVHDFMSHYYPNVLHAMRTRWISPQVVTTNRINSESYTEVKVLGRRVIQALGIGTSATHMEWFFGPKGLKFSEIGCRPPGVGMWDIYQAANDFNIYHEWAMAICYGSRDRQPSRRFSAGMIALRPDRDGTIAGYQGIEKVTRKYSEYIIDAVIPPPGTPTQPVEAGYWANAYLRLRHPDYDQLLAILDDIGETIQVYAK